MKQIRRMRTRHGFYLNLLHIALLNARRAAAEGDARHAFTEADHLHNLPDLLRNMDDEDGHRQYWEMMRPSYLSISKPDWVKTFERLWDELEVTNTHAAKGIES